MEKLNFDTGIKEYQINGGGVLRFNPADTNVYNRFFEAKNNIEKLGEEYAEKEKAAGAEVQTDEKGFATSAEKDMSFMREIDRKAKEQLAYVFGTQNDFDALFDGVNLMAPGSNGEAAITNFFAAMQPIIEDGLRRYTKLRAKEAKHIAQLNREQRRAMEKKA